MTSSSTPANPNAARTVFFVSDGTGITAETFGHAVLSQFEMRFRQIRLPFIDTIEKAYEAARRINEVALSDNQRTIVFSTLVKHDLSAVIRAAQGMHMDLFQTFVAPLEQELGVKSTHTIGRIHNVVDSEEYKSRIEAINFSLAHDDGQSHKNLAEADVILVGVSRSGKTPTSLYLAMQYGIKAANYPLIPDDFERNKLPSALWRRKSRKASAVVAKPPGTRTPASASWLIISPSEAFLPPTDSTSVMRRFSKEAT
jgi:regulator of PEP synthase PpsR (kinase-PPPase family)